MVIFFQGGPPVKYGGRQKNNFFLYSSYSSQKRGETTTGSSNTPITRDPVSAPSSTSRNFPQNKTGNSHKRSPEIVGFTFREQAKGFRDKHGHGYRRCPVGGCLVHFVRNWKQISSDHWILGTISGYRMEFQTGSHSPDHTFGCTEGTSFDRRGGEGSSCKRSYSEGST